MLCFQPLTFEFLNIILTKLPRAGLIGLDETAYGEDFADGNQGDFDLARFARWQARKIFFSKFMRFSVRLNTLFYGSR